MRDELPLKITGEQNHIRGYCVTRFETKWQADNPKLTRSETNCLRFILTSHIVLCVLLWKEKPAAMVAGFNTDIIGTMNKMVASSVILGILYGQMLAPVSGIRLSITSPTEAATVGQNYILSCVGDKNLTELVTWSTNISETSILTKNSLDFTSLKENIDATVNISSASHSLQFNLTDKYDGSVWNCSHGNDSSGCFVIRTDNRTDWLPCEDPPTTTSSTEKSTSTSAALSPVSTAFTKLSMTTTVPGSSMTASITGPHNTSTGALQRHSIDDSSVVIACAVGGLVLLTVIIFLLVCCLLRRRRSRHRRRGKEAVNDNRHSLHSRQEDVGVLVLENPVYIRHSALPRYTPPGETLVPPRYVDVPGEGEPRPADGEVRNRPQPETEELYARPNKKRRSNTQPGSNENGSASRDGGETGVNLDNMYIPQMIVDDVYARHGTLNARSADSQGTGSSVGTESAMNEYVVYVPRNAVTDPGALTLRKIKL